jgi:hypothetical protein
MKKRRIVTSDEEEEVKIEKLVEKKKKPQPNTSTNPFHLLLNGSSSSSLSPSQRSEDIRRKQQHVYSDALKIVEEENFTSLTTRQLSALFYLIERHHLEGTLRQILKNEGRQISFRLSQRMTSRAGQLLTEIDTPQQHELAISTYLLFQTFSSRNQIHRPITVNGLSCTNRLHCLLRLVEHEMVHLLLCCTTLVDCFMTDRHHEYVRCLSPSSSSFSPSTMPGECYHGPTFQLLAGQLFGHTEWTHDLPTPKEIAYQMHQLTVGTLVQFYLEGELLTGKVNRIQKRVTVLVKDNPTTSGKYHPDSREYSDGCHYRKCYVPIGECEVVEEKKSAKKRRPKTS